MAPSTRSRKWATRSQSPESESARSRRRRCASSAIRRDRAISARLLRAACRNQQQQFLFMPGHDMYDSFCSYQAALLKQFDDLGEEYKFEIVDASADAKDICDQLKTRILGILNPDLSPAVVSNSQADLIETLTQRVVGNLLSKRNGAGKHPDSKVEMTTPLIAHSSEGNGRVTL